MLDVVHKWFNEQGNNKNEVLNRLSSDMVKAGRNRRLGDNSASTGHVHNQMLPEGGLQQVLAQHQIHVVSTESVSVLIAARCEHLECRPGHHGRQDGESFRWSV